MGNKISHQERWIDLKFKRTRLPDVNDFCEEIKVYNLKINKIRDALILAEKNLILYLGLADIETLTKDTYKITLKEVTLSIFFSFNAFFRGEFIKMLNLKFNDKPPYFEINIHYLNPLLKDAWLQYQNYLTTLENTNSFCQALIKKYKIFYTDYYERFSEFMQELIHPSDKVQMDRLMYNFNQIVRVGQNLGCLDAEIQQKYELIKDALYIVKEGTETIQTAVVCRVNKIKYPDECLAKILQLQSIPAKGIYDTPEYKHNQQRNFERYLFVSNKYLPTKDKEPQEVFDEQEFEEDLLNEHANRNSSSKAMMGLRPDDMEFDDPKVIPKSNFQISQKIGNQLLTAPIESSRMGPSNNQPNEIWKLRNNLFQQNGQQTQFQDELPEPKMKKLINFFKGKSKK